MLRGIPPDDLAIKLDHLWREATHDKTRDDYQRRYPLPPRVPKAKDGSDAGSPYLEHSRSMSRAVSGEHAGIEKCAACAREVSEVAYD